MADPVEKQQNPVKGTNHRAEALSLLGDFRPPAGSADAIAAAQVHATLAQVQAQTDVAHLLSLAIRELNATNMFKQAEVLPEDHPLRPAIQNGLLNHMTQNGVLRTDVMLAVRIQDLGLEVKAGDDLVVATSDGARSIRLLAIDPDEDAWLLMGDDPAVLDRTVDTPKIHSIFNEEIRSLTVTLQQFPNL